jgi:Na+/melibiose symporter-like transporter
VPAPRSPEPAPVPDHRLVWLLGSSTAANIGDGIGKVAFPLLAASITRDPILIAGLSALSFLPWLLFAFLSGALVDRVDRRAAMLLANGFRAGAVGLLGVLVVFDAVSIWLIYLVAFVLGTVETVADSTANALIPAVVGRERLESANSKLQSVEIVGQTFLGGPVGSLTFALFAAAPFLLNSAGFAVAAALLVGMTGNYRPRAAQTRSGLRRQLGEGLRWVATQPLLRRLVIIAGAMALTTELAQALLVLYALQDLGIGAAAFGVFVLLGGVGGLVGAAVASRLTRRLPRHVVLVLAMVAAGTGFLGMSVLDDAALSGVLFGLFAAAIVVVNVILGTIRHAFVPEGLFGRVLGVWRTVVWGAIPLGALFGGLLAGALGTRAVFAISGTAQFLLAVWAWRTLTSHRREVDTLQAALT